MFPIYARYVPINSPRTHSQATLITVTCPGLVEPQSSLLSGSKVSIVRLLKITMYNPVMPGHLRWPFIGVPGSLHTRTLPE